MRMRRVPGGQLAGQVGDHGAFETRRKTHVIDHAHPFALRVQRLDVRRDHFDPRLIGGIHRGRGEIVGVSVDDQAQRLVRIPGAKIELQPVQLRKAGERQALQNW